MKALSLLLPLSLLTAVPAFAAPSPAACPDIARQLNESLASAQRRIAADGDMRVEFEVDSRGHARLVDAQGMRRYLTPVRIAIDSLDCHAGTPNRYVLDIRFADPVPRTMAAAAATLAQARPVDQDATRP